MAGPTKKVNQDLDGDTPEQVAWGLLEWIRLIEDVRDRQGILSTFHAGLMAARAGMDQPVSAAGQPLPVTGVQRRLAYKLMYLVAEAEGRDPGQRNQGDRSWVIETYAACLEAVMGRWQATAA